MNFFWAFGYNVCCMLPPPPQRSSLLIPESFASHPGLLLLSSLHICHSDTGGGRCALSRVPDLASPGAGRLSDGALLRLGGLLVPTAQVLQEARLLDPCPVLGVAEVDPLVLLPQHPRVRPPARQLRTTSVPIPAFTSVFTWVREGGSRSHCFFVFPNVRDYSEGGSVGHFTRWVIWVKNTSGILKKQKTWRKGSGNQRHSRSVDEIVTGGKGCFCLRLAGISTKTPFERL